MRPMLLSLLLTITMLLPLALSPTPARSADCQFVLGFLTLKNLIPDVVGPCSENVRYNPATGDALQATGGSHELGGLLVWRKADNYTAFTDGYRTWVNGPLGLQQRLNGERFFWESNVEGLPIIPTPVGGDPCHTAGLSITLEDIGAAAGNVVATFAFKNETAVDCTLFGFVGAQLLDSQNNPLPTRVVRGGGLLMNDPGPTLVTVEPGLSAAFRMHWGAVEVGGETMCPTAVKLAVIPPDEFDPLIIPVQITACNAGLLNVSAVRPPG